MNEVERFHKWMETFNSIYLSDVARMCNAYQIVLENTNKLNKQWKTINY